MDFNITNFNERLKSVKLRELVVAGIAAIILGEIGRASCRERV